jgi:type II secretory pathway predicted ATPase ExeA/outer membrane protein OmpA-like peptidoglycan-associated protein
VFFYCKFFRIPPIPGLHNVAYPLKSAPIAAFRAVAVNLQRDLPDRCPLRSNAAEYSVQGQLVGHFGLRENAFGVTPDPRFLFLSQTHREALASLVNGIDCDFGFQVLVAQPGMGKTTLLFNFLERFRNTAHTAFLFQTQLNPCELLQSVLHELGTNSEETSLRKLSEQLNQVLARAAQERKRVIVVLDEAQTLDFSVLEALRQLSNFEAASTKLMQIVLAGQPQLAKRLALPEQEQLMQRICVFGRLSPLALNETQAYIDHRLATAGYQGASLFTPGAVRKIWDHSRGVPRNINTLCFNAMLLAFADRVRSIDERIVGESARDLDLNSVLADVYQMEPSRALSGGSRRVQPIRETLPSELDSARAEVIAQPVVVAGSIAKDEGATASAVHSGNGVPAGAIQNVPLAPVATPVPIGPIIGPVIGPVPEEHRGEQKTVSPGKSAQLAEVQPIAAPTLAVARTQDVKAVVPVAAPANSGKASQPTTPAPIQSSTKAAARANKTANAGKNYQPKKREEPVRPEREMALTTAPLNKKMVAEKRSESRIWWTKALALTAITGILAFLLGEEFLAQHPGQVEAGGSVTGQSSLGQSSLGQSSPDQSSQAQSNSGPGYSAPNEAPASGTDTSGAQPRTTPADSLGARKTDSSEADDVTVRKFPTDADAAYESSGKTQKLDTIFFDQDSALIGSQYGPFLRRIADALAKNPGASAILEGHTDDTGPESYNQELSSRRAIEVRNALVDELHVSTTRLTAVGAGATSPAQPNSSASGRAYNRRVEVRLVHLGA